MTSPPPHAQPDADRPPGQVYDVDPASSAAALFRGQPARWGLRRRPQPATITGSVTLNEALDPIAADLVLSPRPARSLLSRNRRHRGWQRAPTLLTTIRVYRVDSMQYRAEIDLRCQSAAGRAVLSLTRWTSTQADLPTAMRFRAATLTDRGARDVHERCGSNSLPQVYMRIVLVPEAEPGAEAR